MNNPLRSLLLGAVAVFAATASLFAAPTVGSPAPDFTAKDIAGNVVKLDAYKGKVVVLEWFNPECPFVKKFYAPGKMQELQRTYATKGVVWFSVYSTAPKHRDGFDSAGLKKVSADWKTAPAALLDDASGDLARLYAAKTTPDMFVIGADGKLDYAGAIDSVRSPKSDDIAKAVPYFTNALDAVIAGKTPEPATTKSYGCGIKL